MSLEDDLLRKGYLPEMVPPSFHTDDIADHFAANPSAVYLTQHNSPVRWAPYSASKRGLARRSFSVVHPTTAHDLGRFIALRKAELDAHLNKSAISRSTPRHEQQANRAILIATHSEVDEYKYGALASYRYIVKTDISRFYHSIYTHSIPWAVHGRVASKKDRAVDSAAVFCNRLDQIIRQGQDGQTIGIPVGPDASRIISELITVAIDEEFLKRVEVKDFKAVRHVDDIWVGTNSHADAEKVLWTYREAMREFELDINESKTAIKGADFQFADAWPMDVSSRLRHAEFGLKEEKRRDDLRAALEWAFASALAANDDGIIKYVVRFLDRSGLAAREWEMVEPFLKRSVVHFGHTIDYVTRVLVWRRLVHDDVDLGAWGAILSELIVRHAHLGNDNEVCWAVYASLRLKVRIPEEAMEGAVRNCGPLSIVALLSCVESGLLDQKAFAQAQELVSLENASGRYWPLLLHWVSSNWPDHAKVQANLQNPLIEQMAANGVLIFDQGRLQRTFEGVDESDFGDVSAAIEAGDAYDDPEPPSEEDLKEIAELFSKLSDKS